MQNLKPTILINRSLRSGQNINYDGNVVILGDVNAGAEVVASGNIIVVGALRGLVHAGATGAEDVSIIALSLTPVQICIAAHITRPPDGGHHLADSGAEMAFIRDGKVVIEKYQTPK